LCSSDLEKEFVITRCSYLYGSADVNFSRIIPNTIKLLLKGESPIIWKGSEDAIREFLYVEDAVDGYLELIKNIQTTKGQSFNIGSEYKITIKDLVNMLIFKINKNLSITNINEFQNFFNEKNRDENIAFKKYFKKFIDNYGSFRLDEILHPKSDLVYKIDDLNNTFSVELEKCY